MTVSQDQANWFSQAFDQMTGNIARVVVGKHHVVRLVLTAMLAEGHVLLEDVPGTGKTQLARALAATVSGTHNRIQFTPDLLPSDITGVSVFDPQKRAFEFHAGPVFSTIVVADEINRASPKTQAALLEVMEEGRVTLDGKTHELGRPFMVIATQNPVEQAGTYALPEAQLDRFLLRTALGYPDHEAMVQILAESGTRDRSAGLRPVITSTVVAEMARLADGVHVDPAILAWVSRLSEESRRNVNVRLGISVRGCLALVRCARTWALSQGRNHVVPDDIKALAQPVLGHRVLLTAEAEFAGTTVERVVDQIFAEVAPPAERR
ncbi:AAA family ATPase [Janibacter massiliensis]|uniref:AAA family ATPase n=1 Tax=Janibacter massiliensis TaxID=2058291 RepID=UPI000D0F9544|nr:MoxR family ATPase [Janibacter massiliensis]